MIVTEIYLIWIGILSLITIILYGIDKKRAIKQKMRIRESTLFLFSFLGGSLGSIIGMAAFAHKTKHVMFWILNILFLFIHIVILVIILINEIPNVIH